MIAPEDFSVREEYEGWFEIECDLCGVTSKGCEPALDDWAYEHQCEFYQRDIGFAG
jgi:hypothetical protein